MNLDPRAIALQGIGFSPLLIAVQGLLPAEQSSGGTWNQRDELRRFLREQEALDEARRANLAAEAALDALAEEQVAEAERAQALRRVRDTADAYRQLQAEVKRAEKRFDEAPQAPIQAQIAPKQAEIATQAAVSLAKDPGETLAAGIDVTETPEARRRRRNRQRAAVLAALLLLDS